MASERVSIGDIEARFRAIASGASEMVSARRAGLATAALLGGVGLLAGSFLLGRRRGRRRASILEIHRV